MENEKEKKEQEVLKEQFRKEAQRLRKRFSNDEITDEERAQDAFNRR